MAVEAAGIAWAAEEMVSTTVQVGIGAYMVSKPTMPLKATFNQIATSSDDATRLSLSRADHTLSIVKEKAYIFGGQTAAGKLASNDIHAINLMPGERMKSEYSVIPAVADTGSTQIPGARRKHAASSFNICVAVYSGLDENGKIIDEGSNIWLFNTDKNAWESLEPANPGPGPRSSASLFDHDNNLLLYGGEDAQGKPLKDVWLYSYVRNTWTQLPEAPVATTSAAAVNGWLHLISGSDSMSSDLHLLPISPAQREEQEWHTIEFPTNPLTPGPRPRAGAGLIPITTGYGRHYLLYLFGARKGSASTAHSETEPPKVEQESSQLPQYWSDIWTYQLPSADVKPASITDSIKPAKIKDSIRSAFGVSSGGHSWSEVEVLPPTDMEAMAGKVHPGPRGFFGYDVAKDGRRVVVWGGINAKGEKEGDGWIIRLS
ncbi:hypothetical protein EJ03DRAFT_210819 [Teratosphaeria nubilosa]|uniref:Galactose oxidase n=1 Tax=Teratosphaeria nubilosa TaxID=161662 RepID=A0A6G1KXF5_9PEZI|nr:hypothetical protein EJ03DRAFT_210819 [Teratosphaeria nubilosa]